MAIFLAGTGCTSTTGTADVDIILMQECSETATDTVTGGGDDLIIGDIDLVFQDLTIANCA